MARKKAVGQSTEVHYLIELTQAFDKSYRDAVKHPEFDREDFIYAVEALSNPENLP